jgi:peptide-methionine (S)-S-oxide reductase
MTACPLRACARIRSIDVLISNGGAASMLLSPKLKMPSSYDALPGRAERVKVGAQHAVLGTPLDSAFEGYERAMFALGCFWGAERKLWRLEGVFSTQVGYAAGYTPNPTYEEVCSGLTGHAEVVRVIFDPAALRYEELLRVFWESHDPTQGMAQGNDVGTQYRSGIYVFSSAQQSLASTSRLTYQRALTQAGYGAITTEIIEAPELYFAEDYHQQYLAKNPSGYCGLGGTGVRAQLDEPLRDSGEL